MSPERSERGAFFAVNTSRTSQRVSAFLTALPPEMPLPRKAVLILQLIREHEETQKDKSTVPSLVPAEALSRNAETPRDMGFLQTPKKRRVGTSRKRREKTLHAVFRRKPTVSEKFSTPRGRPPSYPARRLLLALRCIRESNLSVFHLVGCHAKATLHAYFRH